MIKKFRRKPVEVEALQYTGDNEEEFKNIGVSLDQPDSTTTDYMVFFKNGIIYHIAKNFYVVRSGGHYEVYKEKDFKNKFDEISKDDTCLINEKDLIPLIQNEKQWCTSDYCKGWNDALDAITTIILREMERKY